MIVHKPKRVKKANLWVVTTVENIDTKVAKKKTKQTQYWFSIEQEALTKYKELEE